jgi:hypothetical protein
MKKKYLLFVLLLSTSSVLPNNSSQSAVYRSCMVVRSNVYYWCLNHEFTASEAASMANAAYGECISL